jgi:hypothetical protein
MARMRLRSRSRRSPGEGWLTARDAGGWTTVGNLDSPVRAAVDPAGLVSVAGRSWSLDWWIGAEDRWHVPAREMAVRQVLVGNSPVVETRLRVPSGDAVQRVYAARGLDGQEALVVEVHNETKVPFAVALAVRPYDVGGTGAVGRIALDGTTVRVDGGPALVLPRSPGRFVLSDAAGDAAEVVFAGAAEPARSADLRCPDGRANGALLFPLAHTATLRVALPLDGSGPIDLAALPDAAQVASGWAAVARSGARLEVPNRRLRDAVAASARFLLLGGADPDVATALDLLGYPVEAERRLQEQAGKAPGRSLAAIGRHWALTRDVDAAVAAVPLVAALVPLLARPEDAADAQRGHAALPEVAALLDAVGEPRAAADVRAVEGWEPEAGAPVEPDLETLLAGASPTWTWSTPRAGHDVRANASLVAAVRRLLVQEVAGGLALGPAVPEAWLGQGWEVHDLPTTEGRLSYAIRWHGDRPALLWDLEPLVEGRAPRLTVPSLDPEWSTTDRRGEALLGAVPVPERAGPRRGLSIPVTVEPTRRGPR